MMRIDTRFMAADARSEYRTESARYRRQTGRVTRPTARVLALLEILQSGGTRTVAELAERLAVDERTVRRYVDHLSTWTSRSARCAAATAATGSPRATACRR